MGGQTSTSELAGWFIGTGSGQNGTERAKIGRVLDDAPVFTACSPPGFYRSRLDRDAVLHGTGSQPVAQGPGRGRLRPAPRQGLLLCVLPCRCRTLL